MKKYKIIPYITDSINLKIYTIKASDEEDDVFSQFLKKFESKDDYISSKLLPRLIAKAKYGLDLGEYIDESTDLKTPIYKLNNTKNYRIHFLYLESSIIIIGGAAKKKLKMPWQNVRELVNANEILCKIYKEIDEEDIKNEFSEKEFEI